MIVGMDSVSTPVARAVTHIRYVNANVSGGVKNGTSWVDAYRYLQDALLDYPLICYKRKESNMKYRFVVAMVLGIVVIMGIGLFLPDRLSAQEGVPLTTANSAEGWFAVASPTNSRLLGVVANTASDVWATGGAYYYDQDPIILHKGAGAWSLGYTFTSTTQHFHAIDFGSATEGWAVGYQVVAHYNGGAWTHEDWNTKFPYRVRMLSGTDGWMVGFRYVFDGGFSHVGLIRKYNGSTWSEQCDTLNQTYTDVSMVDANQGWIVGADSAAVIIGSTGALSAPQQDGGVILHRIDAGSGWVQQATTPEVLYTVYAVSSDEAWAAGENGLIMHYTAGGGWQSVASPVDTTLRRVVMTSASAGWIVGMEGTILRYTGDAWQQVSNPTAEDLFDIAVLGPDEAWAVGDNGTILHYVQPPTAAFDAAPTSGLMPLTVDFTDTSTGQVDERVWSFGDGGTETGATITSHTYTQGGTYDAQLTVSSAGGSSTAQQAIVVGDWGNEALVAGSSYTKTLTEPGTYIINEVSVGFAGEIVVTGGHATVERNMSMSTNTITVTQSGFVPKSMTVPVSTTVTWVVAPGDVNTYSVLGYGPVYRIFLPLVLRAVP